MALRSLRTLLTIKQRPHQTGPSRLQLKRKASRLRIGFLNAARSPRRGVRRLRPRARMVEGINQLCLIGGATTP